MSRYEGDSDYPFRPGFKSGDTSAAAADAMARSAPTIRARCLNVLRQSPGLTADEVAAQLGISILAVRPRISELRKLGKIQKGQGRRRNASGMGAAVWEPVADAA